MHRLCLDLALRRRQLAPQCGAPCAFLVKHLTVFRRAGDEFLSRSRGLACEGSRLLPFAFERFCGVCGCRLLELPHFFARLAQLRRLQLVFALHCGEFGLQCGTACAFLVERLTVFRCDCGQLLSRRRGLLREGSGLLPFLLERLCAVRGCRLPGLPSFLAYRAQLLRLRLVFAPRGGKFALQRVAACAFFVERLTAFRRACGRHLSRSRDLLSQGDRFLPLLFERLCAVRSRSLQLHIEFLDSPRSAGRLCVLLDLHSLRPRPDFRLAGHGLLPKRQ
ncbi:hypothetical protein [Bradyrhizobium sp. AZCC 1610]|uniref:hypothetical protein n=1 Tax=Bradyrhizobium sp. AZCC 1610 TaxID=3117020 RepID=UPI002FF019EB